MSNQKYEFINSLCCDAKSISKEIGMSLEFIQAQAAQEYRWLSSTLGNGLGGHSLANINSEMPTC
jgi:flagellum-specific peptidoglycan hydrolase FlgJ